MYGIDLVVANEVVVELNTVERLLSVRQAQPRTYLELTRKRVGLIINFNVVVPHRGIIRRVPARTISSVLDVFLEDIH